MKEANRKRRKTGKQEATVVVNGTDTETQNKENKTNSILTFLSDFSTESRFLDPMIDEQLPKVLVVLAFISIVLVAIDQPIVVWTERFSTAVGLLKTVASPTLQTQN